MPLDPWFEMSNDMLCEASLDGYFTRLNTVWTHCLGFSRQELMSQPYTALVHPDDLQATFEAAGGLAAGPSEVVNFENRFRTKLGDWRWLEWSSRSDGERIYGVARDVSQRKTLEAERDVLLTRLEVMARTDQLTGLPNRRAWDEELRREMHRVRRYGGSLAVGLLDLDRFKDFNDAHGHPGGDELLKEAATAWRLVLRVTDCLARYGGEEFALALAGSPTRNPMAVLDRLRAATPGGVTVSVGLAIWDHEETVDEVISRADKALYQAKRDGRNASRLAG